MKKEYKDLVKYISGNNKVLSPYVNNEEKTNYLNEKRIIEDCKSNITRYFENQKINMEYVSIDIGKAFEVDVELHFWILEKDM